MNNCKINKITTQKQFAKMVQLLEEKPELAQSYHNSLHKLNTKEEWNKIAEKLNPLGPPSRQGNEWMKVWADFKCNLKKKIIHNKNESRATGGGSNKQYTLTPIEEAASSLLQLNSIINPEGDAVGIQPNSSNKPELDDDSTTTNKENEALPTPRIRRKGLNKTASEKNVLIEEQLKVQTNLYTEVKQSLNQIERYSRKLHKIEEEKLKLYKSQMKRKEEKFNMYKSELKKKEEHRSLLIKLRQEEIEIKKRRIELEEWKHGFQK